MSDAHFASRTAATAAARTATARTCSTTRPAGGLDRHRRRDAPGHVSPCRHERCPDQCPVEEGARVAPLCGRRLALVCASEDAAAAVRFRRAAERLGAQVATLPAERLLEGHGGLAALVVVLGRLYDAIECQDLPAATIGDLAERAAIPVFDGLGMTAGVGLSDNDDAAIATIQTALLRAFRIEGA